MDIETWKTDLVRQIETAAEWRAELILADPDDPRIESSQKALFQLAEQIRALPPHDHDLKALFNEESELQNLVRSKVGEPEGRYYDAKQDLLRGYGIDHETVQGAGQFLRILRDRVDETISEYRLRA
jgi:hypothetical protein